MKARMLMSPDPVAVTPGDPLLRAAAAMRDLDVGMVPVVDGRETMRPVGVITDRDIVVRHVAAGHVHAADTVSEVMRKMVTHRVRRVLVVEGGRLVGVISAADLLAREGRLAPELVEKVLEQISEPALVGV